MMRRLALLTLACCLAVSTAQAQEPAEPLTIVEVLDDTMKYHLQVVHLQGTVRHVEEIEPYYLPTGSACYGAYRFVLVDDTGMVPVSVLGICGRPVIRPPEVSEGDTILLDASIERLQTNTTAEEPGAEGKSVNTVRAVAKKITRLGN
ncbi:MAG TPA: hypothetical protein VFA38_07915 [Nitrospirales bacterium]|nr:hypothetical protein [Nitrospirales bacterium]